MSDRPRTVLAQFILPEGDGELLVWRYEDELPATGDQPAWTALLGEDIAGFRFWHGQSEHDCGGTIDRHRVSSERSALLCDSCGLRISIPRSTNTLVRLATWGEARRWIKCLSFTDREWRDAHAELERRRRIA